VTDCLFCRIVAKELEADVAYESDAVLAFNDINPGAPTHLLVIPKRHVGSAAELGAQDGDLLGEIFASIASLAAERGLDHGWRVVTNVGRDSGQSVHHLHFHLLGGRQMGWPPG